MHWTPKTEARGQLAARLKTRATTAPIPGLKLRDLDALIAHGTTARDADREQQAELARARVARSTRAEDASKLRAFDRSLREVAPAVVTDLEAEGHTEDAALLRRVSFARFRQRELQPPGGSEAPADEDPLLRAVTLVARDDNASFARGLASYCDFLLRPGHERLADAFAERDVARSALADAQRQAEALSAVGSNQLAASSATQREHDAVAAQQQVWSAVRRLVRRAVEGDPELSQLYARC